MKGLCAISEICHPIRNAKVVVVSDKHPTIPLLREEGIHAHFPQKWKRTLHKYLLCVQHCNRRKKKVFVINK